MTELRVVEDAERLEALRRTGLLDTPAEEAFDELTRLVCAVLCVPIALVSLVDRDRQFFKSCTGLPEPWASRRETPLSHSFCQHVVETGQRLVIEDARNTPLVQGNLAIEELGVVAYAGVPLRLASGHSLGTLCVIDHVPRVWRASDLQLLEHLGACALNRIEIGQLLREAQDDLADRQRQAAEFSGVLDSSLDAVIAMDARGHIVRWNQQAVTIFGWTAEEVIGRDLAEVIVPERFRESHRAGLTRFLSTGEHQILSRRIELAGLHRDGHEVPIELNVNPVRVGEEWRFTAFLRDLTSRKESEGALQAATNRFALVASATNDAVWDWDVADDTIWWSDAFEILFGYRREELERGIASRDTRIHPDDRQRVADSIRDALEGEGRSWSAEYRFRRADGDYAEILDRGYVVRDEAGVPMRVVGAMMDATSRRRAEQQLRVSEIRYRLLFESNPEAMWVFDIESLRFLAVNDAAIRRYGFSREEFLQMTARDIRTPPHYDQLEQMLKRRGEGASAHADVVHRTKDGTTLHAEVLWDDIMFDGRPALLVLAQDLTARRQLEQQLRQAQKLEAVGRLAGGVAHDFNNLLTAILGSADLLLEMLPPEHPGHEEAAESRKAALRAADLTRQLLAFSRQQVMAPRLLDLNAVVANVDRMLRRLLGERVNLRTILATDPTLVLADAGQMEQVIVNLALNARDAMPDGGDLTVEISRLKVGEAGPSADEMILPGEYARIEVRDTGVGMDAATAARAFEPFFTTKPTGQGTGLGLATVYGIIKQSGGYIALASVPEMGSTIAAYLPSAEPRPEAASRTPHASLAPGAGETILVVEDQEEVRSITQRVLAARGYRVLTAANGADALRLAEDFAEPIHLLLSDVVMPGMNGRDLSRRLVATRPDLKVLFVSGYPDSSIALHGVLDPEVELLQKPFAAADLARRVREVIDG